MGDRALRKGCSERAAVRALMCAALGGSGVAPELAGRLALIARLPSAGRLAGSLALFVASLVRWLVHRTIARLDVQGTKRRTEQELQAVASTRTWQKRKTGDGEHQKSKRDSILDVRICLRGCAGKTPPAVSLESKYLPSPATDASIGVACLLAPLPELLRVCVGVSTEATVMPRRTIC